MRHCFTHEHAPRICPRRASTGWSPVVVVRRGPDGQARADRGVDRLDARRLRHHAVLDGARESDRGLEPVESRGRPARFGRAAGVGRGRHRVRIHRRPLGPDTGADRQRARLLGVHRHVRSGPERRPARGVSRAARVRHGRGVGERRRAHLRNLARRASRQGVRRHAEHVGGRLRRRRPRHRARPAPMGLARGVLCRRAAGAVHAVGATQRRRAADVARCESARPPGWPGSLSGTRHLCGNVQGSASDVSPSPSP